VDSYDELFDPATDAYRSAAKPAWSFAASAPDKRDPSLMGEPWGADPLVIYDGKSKCTLTRGQHPPAAHDIAPEEIPMNRPVCRRGRSKRVVTARHKSFVSTPDDLFAIRAEIALFEGFSTCPVDAIAPTNGWHITPMRVELRRPIRVGGPNPEADFQ
jgi:hypothetical protein